MNLFSAFLVAWLMVVATIYFMDGKGLLYSFYYGSVSTFIAIILFLGTLVLIRLSNKKAKGSE